MKKTPSMGYLHRPLLALLLSTLLLTSSVVTAADQSRFPDEPVPLKVDEVPERPELLIEWGDKFLGRGNIRKGYAMPGGSIWQPSFSVYGTLRTALQSQHNGSDTTAEWVNRLDIFANLQLTATERFLIGFRPLERGRMGEFTGYTFEPSSRRGWDSYLNGNIETLFFEGELGEIFANWDREDFKQLDIGFSIGRQRIATQSGILINDTFDALGVTFNNLHVSGASNHQLTFVGGFRNIHRGNNELDDHSRLFGVTSAIDWMATSMVLDFVLLNDRRGKSDGVCWGMGFTQRINHYATTFRLLGSQAFHSDSDKMNDGVLFFAETSWTPPYGHDHVYINGFWGIDHFRSAARAPETGGPLGGTGLLFSAPQIGSYGAPLSNQADEAVGGVIGYQRFFQQNRRQVVLELGARRGTRSSDNAAAALGGRYQQAFGQHVVMVLDAYAQRKEHRSFAYGTRAEAIFKF